MTEWVGFGLSDDGAPAPVEHVRYRTILMDPPWPPPAGTEKQGETFPKVPWEDLAALPLADIADDACHLYCWVLRSEECHRWAREIMQRNGFVLKNRLIWVKTSKDGNIVSSPFGAYFQYGYEELLFGVRGKLPAQARTHSDVIVGPRRPPVARKPDEQYEYIEAMSPPPRIELFARYRRPGWHIWGNEVDSDIALQWNGRNFHTAPPIARKVDET